MSEPIIIINGYRLAPAQSLAVRVAVSDLYMESCTDPHALGKDDLGIGLTAAYKARSREVLEIMSKTQPDPVDPPTRLRKSKVTVEPHV